MLDLEFMKREKAWHSVPRNGGCLVNDSCPLITGLRRYRLSYEKLSMLLEPTSDI